MKLAKTFACGAAAVGVAMGTAFAVEGQSGMNDSGIHASSGPTMVQGETVILLEPVDVTSYDVYGIDENRDGVTDSYLILEQSDTLG